MYSIHFCPFSKARTSLHDSGTTNKDKNIFVWMRFLYCTANACITCFIKVVYLMIYVFIQLSMFRYLFVNECTLFNHYLFFLILEMYKKYIYQSWFIFIFLWHLQGYAMSSSSSLIAIWKEHTTYLFLSKLSFVVWGVGVYVGLTSKLSIPDSFIIQSI